ncbi:MAG: alpha-L-fucosidase [Holophagaceae bacterium]|nr:alpha-L-fucosidase [Holophagaceae bacterium]
MFHISAITAILLVSGLLTASPQVSEISIPPTAQQNNDPDRMAWWRDARFGMFIHWGLYSVPAGEWDGKTGYGEWILNSAKIPVNQYENFRNHFNPTKFDAEVWVKMAVDAGFKYIVVTTKHHEGFCLFDSKLTDWSIASTPFKRDVIKELADACKKYNIKLGFYHSIMDWHHPDYLPRRAWEERSADGATFDRYLAYLKGQLKELLTQYGPISVLWYDGQWESTWTHEMGLDLYEYTRSLQPQIIVNNRVDKGGGSMQMTVDSSYAGDYGTPEQEVPPMGLPGVDWETCMTMNDHWGYNKADQNWKSSTELIHILIDVASKGGNLLLNVGPTALGEFPPASIERLEDIGQWMKINGESIYGTKASPFPSLDFGRCTQRTISDRVTKLYFHVFEWPTDNKLTIPGLYSKVNRAYLLSNPTKRIRVTRSQRQPVVELPPTARDPHATVVVVEINGSPDISLPPSIKATNHIFDKELDVIVTAGNPSLTLHYSLDGSEPTIHHPIIKQNKITIDQTRTIKVRTFRGKTPSGSTSEETFVKVLPKSALKVDNLVDGVNWDYFEGDFTVCDDMITPIESGMSANFKLQPAKRPEHFGFRFSGYIYVPATGVFTFYTTSDDGSCLWIDGEKIVDNDKLHGPDVKSGVVALEKGLHAIRLDYFQGTGGTELKVHWQGPDVPKQMVGDNDLYREVVAKPSNTPASSVPPSPT